MMGLVWIEIDVGDQILVGVVDAQSGCTESTRIPAANVGSIG